MEIVPTGCRIINASPAVGTSAGDVPPEIMVFSVGIISLAYMKILHFQHLQNKVAEIRGETKFLGYARLGAYESAPPPKQNFVATPLLVKAVSAAPTNSDRGQVTPHCLPC